MKQGLEASRVVAPGRGTVAEEADNVPAEDILSGDMGSSRRSVSGEAFIKDALHVPDRMSRKVYDLALVKRQYDSQRHRRNSKRLREAETYWLKTLEYARNYHDTKGSASKS